MLKDEYNNMKPQSPIIAGLDIGSSKVTVVIGAVNSENKVEIVVS